MSRTLSTALQKTVQRLTLEEQDYLCAWIGSQLSPETDHEAQRVGKDALGNRGIQAVLLAWMDGKDIPECRDVFRMISDDMKNADREAVT